MSIEPVVSTTAGTKLYVSTNLPATDTLAGFQAVTSYTEVTEIVDVGELNETYNSVDHVSVDKRKTTTLKGVKGAITVTWQLGRVVSDAGQAVLLAKKDSDEYLTYKLVHQDGTVFYCAGPVMGLVTGFSGADTVTSRSLTVAINTNVWEDTATKFTVNYVAGTGGKIVGSPTQVVSTGTDAETVVAVALTGYTFTDWDEDSSTDAERTDTNITASATWTATFTAD
jgi:hypothetical protein